MDKDTYIALEKTVRDQEESLRFARFSNREALDLGTFLVEKVYNEKMDLAICIRKMNGAILFQHMTEGTCLNNQNWMTRKFNTVALMERSSYGAWAVSHISGETIADHGLSETDYILCGGGFPIALKSGEIVAVLTVSNLPHEKDHQFIVDGLEEWLSSRQ
jgi:uncharacterized protein (UPF0303 family)